MNVVVVVSRLIFVAKTMLTNHESPRPTFHQVQMPITGFAVDILDATAIEKTRGPDRRHYLRIGLIATTQISVNRDGYAGIIKSRLYEAFSE